MYEGLIRKLRADTENRQMASELAFGDRLQSHAFVWPSSLRLTE
jgi:hypothetical protein